MKIILLYLKLFILKFEPIPQPKQFNIDLIVSLLITSSKFKSHEFLIFVLNILTIYSPFTRVYSFVLLDLRFL